MRALPLLDDRWDAIRRRWQGELAALLGGDLAAAAARAHVAMELEMGRALLRAPAPDCAAGCSWCCHVHADATVPEILAAAAHVRAALGPEARAALRDRLTAQAARVADLDDDARWAQRIPCALLGADGRCTIYEGRPLRCRAFHSCAVDRCRQAFAGESEAEAVPSPPLVRAAGAVEAAYDGALLAAGLPVEVFRFEIGLLVALVDPTAGDRARAGEDAFAAARPRGG